ncbi:MAG: DinB family protein [Streptosporangiales bacterium]
MTDWQLDPIDRLSGRGERATLEGMLDAYRAEVVRKVAGVTEDEARRRLVPSMTTLGGLVKHLRWVEVAWFQQRFAGVPKDQFPGEPSSEDVEFQLQPDESVASVVADYERACERSREIAAGRSLDDTVPHHALGQLSLRWIYVHMIEETARHAGHADILRELTDGTVGDWR